MRFVEEGRVKTPVCMELVGRQVCACSLQSVEKSIGALTFSLKRSVVLVPALTLA